jgi:cell surface protein SprA
VPVRTLLCAVALTAACDLWAQRADTTRVDTAVWRSRNPYRPSFRPADRYGDPFSNYTTFSPLFLKDPKSLRLDVQVEPDLNYSIDERFGNVPFRPRSAMSFQELSGQQDFLFRKQYFKTRSQALDGESAVSGRNLLPKLYVSPVFDRIFGGSFVEIIPRGNVTLDFGVGFQKIENPLIPIRQQRYGGFEFDQQISLNVIGRIGEKLTVMTNFDNNNSFDFQNNFKVEYTGFKEDVLKKLEMGNVSLPLNNSLVAGAQNLFGIKTQLQFGKLFVTAVATTQRGKQSSIEIPGSVGASGQGRPFEIVGSAYDENRHFFLAQFFRDNYENWLSTLPQITSGLNITRVEVFVLNRQNDTQTLRNIVGMMDMGESDKIYRTDLLTSAVPARSPAANENNNLFSRYLDNLQRRADTIAFILEREMGFRAGTDFERINAARRLAPTEFTFDKELGYITLQRRLLNDEALAVAFEFTWNGRRFKVGELTEDYANRPAEDVIFLKLLRPRKINIRDSRGRIIPTWDLMMKNVYSLNVPQVSRDGFQLRIVYRDDRTGIDNPQLQDGEIARTRQLIEVLGLDRLNPNNDPQPDGNFDFVERITIYPENGTIIFPFLEPFNTPLRRLFALEPTEQARDFLTKKYVFDTLYRTARAEAELVATKNKFFLVGSFRGGSGREIIFQAFNVTPGSVRVLAGGTPLREGVDFNVDYTFGKVTILNEGILSSGKNISVTYEQQDPFAFQTRSLLGTRLDYRLNEHVNIGSTLLYFNERPLITRNLIGTEPARNFKYGLDLNVKKDSRLLTKMVDALPFLETKEVSTVNLNAEFAHLLPGTSNVVQGDGTSFIDDFENSATPFSFINPQNWRLAAVPQTPNNEFDVTAGAVDDVRAGFRRARLAWFTVDNQFYREAGRFRPPNITDYDARENHYTRAVNPNEIFPARDLMLGNFFEPILDIAYYPEERGQYNFNPELTPEGFLQNPTRNFGAITTAIRNEVDWDKTNIEYIEFWLLDPFITGRNGLINDGTGRPAKSNTTGGRLEFHIGSISEDVARDGKHAFENGLPEDGNMSAGAQRNQWGFVTTRQFLNNAFNNSATARGNQDAGLDGATNALERTTFTDFINRVPPAARAQVLEDPSADDFDFFFGTDLDARNAGILERYKKFNGMENNSPIVTGPIAEFGTNLPDNEDLNQDNSLSDLEEYYVYGMDLRPGQLQVGRNYIVDQFKPAVGAFGSEVTWYLFRIPIRQFTGRVGNITGFKSIRYMRMMMTGFAEPVVLRLANFRAVGNRWRRYTANLEESRFGEPIEPNFDNFALAVVNVEENGQGNNEKPPYIPPLARDRDITSPVQRRLNEQALQLCVDDLADGDARAAFKNVTLDFFNYGRLKMFFSAHGNNLQDNELVGFLRIGTDFDENFYEIEIPLKVTPPGNANTLESVWPEENQIDIDLNEVMGLKVQRDRENFPLGQLYPLAGPKRVGRHGIRILGRPELNQVRLMMIGVRNPRSPDGRARDVCLWANELRLTDFDRTAGWAGNVVLNAKLADLGAVTGSLRHTTFGFGGVQSKIFERTRSNTTAYDVSVNLNVDKLLPQNTGLRIPMFASYENLTINPQFDPANPDLRIRAALASFNTDREREAYLGLIRDQTIKRSLNFTNVRKVKVRKDAKQNLWDIENFGFNYSFSEATQSSFNLLENTRRSVRGGVVWQYNFNFKGFEPFKGADFLKSPFLQLIKDFNFNPLPSNIMVRGELDRSYTNMAFRNSVRDAQSSLPNIQKFFVFNRHYNARWALTKSINIDYASRVNAIIDEPDTDIDGGFSRLLNRNISAQEFRDSVRQNLRNLGRVRQQEQTITANYTVPFDKLPLTNWISADVRYNVGYSFRAGPIEQADSLRLGNIIQNTQDQTLNGRLDFVKLYNKWKFLKDANTPKRPLSPLERARQQKNAAADTVKKPPELKGIKSLSRLLMSVRNINGSYTINQGTILPGFMPSPYRFGMDRSWEAPGWGFILGSQDPNVRFRAAQNGWLSTSERLTTGFNQLQNRELNIRGNVEPTGDLRMQLDFRRSVNSTFQEIFRFSADSGRFVSLSPIRGGAYRVSMLTFLTAFQNNTSAESEVFRQFSSNIEIIRDRFLTTRGTGFEGQSQDVLIPAFIAAYSGRDANRVSLSPFPQIPMPNWRLDYNGLNKIKVLQNVFQSVSISHGYSSNYQVMNFTNSLEYSDVGFNRSLFSYNVGDFGNQFNREGQVIPMYVINQVMISEQFAPLMGVNVRTKGRLSARFEYKKRRDLALNLGNSQVTEQNARDWSLEMGYTKNNLKMPFRSQGRVITLKNDVTFRLNVSVTNNITIQRKIDEVNTITNGNINIQIRPNINYVVNQKLNLQMYYERNVNEPLVTNSFPRATTRAGVRVQYNLAQ